MSSVAFRQLTDVVHSIWLHEALHMAPRLEKLVFNLIHKGEVASLLPLNSELAHKLKGGFRLGESSLRAARQVLKELHIRFFQLLIILPLI